MSEPRVGYRRGDRVRVVQSPPYPDLPGEVVSVLAHGVYFVAFDHDPAGDFVAEGRMLPGPPSAAQANAPPDPGVPSG